MCEQCWVVQVLPAGKGGQAALSLTGDEDKLQAAAQLVIGAAAIYDGSVTSLTASQVHTCNSPPPPPHLPEGYTRWIRCFFQHCNPQRLPLNSHAMP